MAGNQSRVVELQIKLQGVKTIEELEEVTREINSELKQIDKNTEAFSDMSKLAKQANGEVKEVNQSLEGVTSSQKARSVAKLGESMVGAFQAAAGASLLFGSQTSEELENVIKKVGGLFAVTDGIKKVTEAFSAENVKSLKALGGEFRTLVSTVKAASLGMKAALISTGIGALVVGVGLLIANFDKIKNMLLGTSEKQKKAAEEEYKVMEGITKLYEAQYETAKKNIELIKENNKYNEDRRKLATAEYEAAVAYSNLIYGQIETLKERNDVIDTYTGKQKKEIGNEKTINEEKIRGLEFELKRAETLASIAKAYVGVANAVGMIEDKIEANKNSLIILTAQADKQRDIYLNQLDTLNNQIKLITENTKLGIELTNEEKDQLDTLNAQIRALNIQEAKRQNILKHEIEALEFERLFNQNLTALSEEYNNINDGIDNEYNLLLKNNTVLTENEDGVKNLYNTYVDLMKEREKISLLDYEGQQRFEEENKYILDKVKAYQDLVDESSKIIENNLEGQKISKEALEIGATELALFTDMSNKTIERLENDKKLINNTLEKLNAEKSELQNLNDINIAERNHYQGLLNQAKVKLENAKNDEERRTALEEVVALEAKVNDINSEIADNKSSIISIDAEIIQSDKDILDINNNIEKTVDDINKKQKQVTTTVIDSSKAYSKINDFINDNRELLQATLDLQSAIFDVLIQQAEKEFNEWVEREEAKLEINIENLEKLADAEISEQERIIEEKIDMQEEYAEMLDDLNDELADAEGERYDDIRTQIEENRAAQEAAAQAEAAAEAEKARIEAELLANKEKLEKEYNDRKKKEEQKAAKLRKQQAISDAIINTALAVLSALKSGFPLGLIMSTIFGALGAVQISLIASTPTYSKGGYTGDGDVNQPAGIVHAGEYVVPQKVVKNPQAQSMLESLEGMRLRGYADGGMVTPTVPNVETTQATIDYKMIGQEVANAIRENPMFVSWVEWKDMNSKMQWIENRASIGGK